MSGPLTFTGVLLAGWVVGWWENLLVFLGLGTSTSRSLGLLGSVVTRTGNRKPEPTASEDTGKEFPGIGELKSHSV